MRLSIKKIITNFFYLLNRFIFFNKIFRIIAKISLSSIKSVNCGDFLLKFYTPNYVNDFRISTFFSKEPETINWINNFDNNSTFLDIGSNIGIYSCYAAMKKSCRVYAIEPSVFNLELLSKNIYLNKLNDNIFIFPIALNNKNLISNFNMTSTEWGGALSTFNQKYTFDGSNFEDVFNYKTLGLSLDNLFDIFKLDYPKYIKIDVDGLESLILEGGSKVFNLASEVLIEIDDDHKDKKKYIENFLKKHQFKLSEKSQSKLFANSNYNKSFNQIWKK